MLRDVLVDILKRKSDAKDRPPSYELVVLEIDQYVAISRCTKCPEWGSNGLLTSSQAGM